MGVQYWIECSSRSGRCFVMQDDGCVEMEIFSGSYDKCVTFIRDLEQSEESED